MDDIREQLREMRELLAKMLEEASGQRYQDQGYDRGKEVVVKDRQEEERRCRRNEEREREARRQERERLEEERREKERLERERLEEERLEKESKEREEKERREREAAEENERIRQRAQKRREESEREKRQKAKKVREEWDQQWTSYQERWVHFGDTASRESNIRDAIPWPVKSGLYRDVNASNVKEFLQKAVPVDANMAKLMRKECLKWHPDRISQFNRDSQLTGTDRMMLDMICRVVTDLISACAGKSAAFLG
jgi:hypothetical protein